MIWYEILGISKSATAAEAKLAYRRLLKLNHPDALVGRPKYEKDQAEERMKIINAAYDTALKYIENPHLRFKIDMEEEELRKRSKLEKLLKQRAEEERKSREESIRKAEAERIRREEEAIRIREELRKIREDAIRRADRERIRKEEEERIIREDSIRKAEADRIRIEKEVIEKRRKEAEERIKKADEEERRRQEKVIEDAKRRAFYKQFYPNLSYDDIEVLILKDSTPKPKEEFNSNDIEDDDDLFDKTFIKVKKTKKNGTL